MPSANFICSDCAAVLPRELAEVHTKGGLGACELCGMQHRQGVTGPITPEQRGAIIEASRGQRVVAGGDGTLRKHRLVSPGRQGKYVHVLDVATVRAVDGGEPWFTCRVQGETPGPSEIYPAYPRSAIDPYVVTRDSLLEREEALKAEIRVMPTSEKLRMAADLLDAGDGTVRAGNITKLALAELEGRLPVVPMPQEPV